MNVVVTRGGRRNVIEVPIAALHTFRVARRMGGYGDKLKWPRLSALMSCDAIPEEARGTFGHSCQHGPPPHEIRVIIGSDNGRSWPPPTCDEIHRLAWEGERLAEAYREGVIVDGE